MNVKHIWLAGVAVAALTSGVVVAQAATTEEETLATRQLNLDQLEKARDGSNTAPLSTSSEDAQDTEDSQGGPEFDGPPAPDEGMTDSEASEPAEEASEPDAEDDTMQDDESAPMD